MRRMGLVAWSVTLLMNVSVHAQNGAPWQFRWQKGQVLSYRVDHATAVSEVLAGNKSETSSRLNLVKRWQVTDVDAKGSATLNLSLSSLRHEQTRPNGEMLLFDSANLDKSTPELKEQMGKFVGKTLASLRVDAQGRVLEVLQGEASRYDSEPPFVVILPGQALQQGQGWRRTFQVTLEPPLGTGEKFKAATTFQPGKFDNGRATLSLTTQFESLPETMADRIPLLQKQPEGQVVFDVVNGRLLSAQLLTDKNVENHQGEGTSYRFRSQYTEQLVP